MFKHAYAELARADECLNIWRAKRPRKPEVFGVLCPKKAGFRGSLPEERKVLRGKFTRQKGFGTMAKRVYYHSKLYLGEGITEEKLDKIKKKLENKPLLSSVFLIAVSANHSDQLDIFDARQLVQSYYKKNPPYVIGITKSREEAISIVEKIVKECLRERGDCALKEYLLC